MPDIKLVITNKYSKKNDSKTLTVKGNCQISNFKPNETKPTGFLFANIQNGKATISQSNGNTQALDFSDEEFKVMQKIASASNKDGKNELSWFDLRDMDKTTLGLDDSFVIKKDLRVGVANIYKKVGDKLTTWLHIDFETKNEVKSADTPATKKSEPQKPAAQKPTQKSATMSYTIHRSISNKYDTRQINIPANTIIHAGRNLYYVNDKGEAFKVKDFKTLEKCNFLELGAMEKVLASIADNDGNKKNLTKEDLEFKNDPNVDLVDRYDEFNGRQSYYVKDLWIMSNSIDVTIDSKVFSDAEHNLKIEFDVDNSKLKDLTLGWGGDNPEDIYNQIDGPSLNSTTLDMINKLNEKDLLATLRRYNNKGVEVDYDYDYGGKRYIGNGSFVREIESIDPVYNKTGMFQDLNDEWGIGIKEIMPIMDKAFKAIPPYMQNNDEYKELKKMIESIDRNLDEDFDQKTIIKIDDLFAKILK